MRTQSHCSSAISRTAKTRKKPTFDSNNAALIIKNLLSFAAAAVCSTEAIVYLLRQIPAITQSCKTALITALSDTGAADRLWCVEIYPQQLKTGIPPCLACSKGKLWMGVLSSKSRRMPTHIYPALWAGRQPRWDAARPGQLITYCLKYKLALPQWYNGSNAESLPVEAL